MKLTAKAINLLRRVKEQILLEPLQFQMEQIFTRYIFGVDADREKIPNCGTAACIAGWVHTLTHKLTPAEADDERGNSSVGEPWNVACEKLGIHDTMGEEANSLFLLSSWPAKFRSPYKKAKTPRGQASVAARRIDAFIEEHK